MAASDRPGFYLTATEAQTPEMSELQTCNRVVGI